MSIELIGYEYLQNVYHNDVSIFKKDNKYEVNYVITVFSELDSDLTTEGLFVKTFLCKNTEKMNSLIRGQTPLESEKYSLISLENFTKTEKNEMMMYCYKVSFSIDKIDFESLSVFSCLSKNPQMFVYNGPAFCDALINPDGLSATSNYVFTKTTGDYGGAVHEHNGGFMEGSFHSSNPHESVTLNNKEDSKILFLDSLRFEEKLGNRKATSYIKAFPFVEDRGGNASFVFAMNLTEMTLQNSKISKSLFRQNQKLFLELSKYHMIKNIKVHREVREKQVGVNRLMMPVESVRTLSSEIICDCSPVNNVLEKTERFILTNKQVVNVDRNKLPEKQTERISSQQNVALEDLNNSRLITSIEQIDPSEQKLFFYQFTDYEVKELTSKTHNYSIEVQIENYVSKYISTLLKSLNFSIETLLQFQKEIDVNNYYDHESLSYKDQFLKMVFSMNNIQLNDNLEPLESEKEKIKNMFHYKAVQIFAQCYELIGPEKYNLQNLFNSLNFSRTNNFMFKKAINLFIDLKNILEKIYFGTKSKHQTSNNFKETSVNNSQDLDGIIQVRHDLVESYNKSINQSIGYSFVSKQKFTEVLKTNNQQIQNRGMLEKQKFFLGNISRNDPVVQNLGSEHLGQFLDFETKAYSHYTPLAIKIGNNEKIIDDFNQRTTEQKFFNILNFSREASQDLEKIVTNDMEYLSSILPSITIVNPPKDSTVILENEEGYYLETSKLINSPFFSTDIAIRKTLDLGMMFSDEKVYTKVQKSIAGKKIRSQIKLSDFNLRSETNKFSNTSINLAEIPLQIKSLMASESGLVKNNFAKNNFNDFQEPESQEVIKQVFLNIKEIKVFEGFSLNNGFYNLDDVNYSNMTSAKLSELRSKNFMCVLENYEIDTSTKKEEKDFKIFDNFFRVINRKENRPKLSSFTPEIAELITYSKDHFSRSSIMKQNPENFGKALRMPLRRARVTSGTPATDVPATIQTTTMGVTNATY